MIDINDTRISVPLALKEHYDKIITKRDELLNSGTAEDKDITAMLRVTTEILRDFTKLQEQAYNAEKFAILQQIVIMTLKEESEELAQKVILAFEEKINDLKRLS